MGEAPRHHAITALKEQQVLLESTQLLFQLFANGGTMELVQWFLAKKFALNHEAEAERRKPARSDQGSGRHVRSAPARLPVRKPLR